MAQPDTVLEISGLRKYFGSVKAVDGVSFQVAKGEIFGFLGPNGAGKTTTIRCIMDFIRPTGGTINVLGHDAHRMSVSLKNEIGYLPGNVRLYDKWTGQEHINFVESFKGKSPSVGDLIDRFSFDPTRKFKQYSSGNRQKLGLILALMHKPLVLIMDEPTLGLDPLLQNEIYEIFAELKADGRTIFISSHNLSEVERVCDTVGIIKDGKLAGVENVSDLRKKSLRKVLVRFAGKFKADDLQVSGVERVEEISDGVILTVRADINPVVKTLAKYELSDLEITRATLEDVFLQFYRGA